MTEIPSTAQSEPLSDEKFDELLRRSYFMLQIQTVQENVDSFSFSNYKGFVAAKVSYDSRKDEFFSVGPGSSNFSFGGQVGEILPINTERGREVAITLSQCDDEHAPSKLKQGNFVVSFPIRNFLTCKNEMKTLGNARFVSWGRKVFELAFFPSLQLLVSCDTHPLNFASRNRLYQVLFWKLNSTTDNILDAEDATAGEEFFDHGTGRWYVSRSESWKQRRQEKQEENMMGRDSTIHGSIDFRSKMSAVHPISHLRSLAVTTHRNMEIYDLKTMKKSQNAKDLVDLEGFEIGSYDPHTTTLFCLASYIQNKPFRFEYRVSAKQLKSAIVLWDISDEYGTRVIDLNNRVGNLHSILSCESFPHQVFGILGDNIHLWDTRRLDRSQHIGSVKQGKFRKLLDLGEELGIVEGNGKLKRWNGTKWIGGSTCLVDEQERKRLSSGSARIVDCKYLPRQEEVLRFQLWDRTERLAFLNILAAQPDYGTTIKFINKKVCVSPIFLLLQ